MSKQKVPRLPVETTCAIVEALGGTSQVSRIVGLGPSAISQWKKFGMPRIWALHLRDRYKRVPAFHVEEMKRL